jgi:opacity protein-like surface antigen
MRKATLLLLLMAACAPLAAAQSSSNSGSAEQSHKVEFFAGYSVIGEVNTGDGGSSRNNNPDFGNVNGAKGVETSVIGNINRYFGIKGDFSAHFDNERTRARFAPLCVQAPCPLITLDAGLKKRFYNFLAGPEFKARNRTRLTPFAHALFGVAHSSAEVKSNDGAFSVSRTDTGFAMAFGGGLDIRASKRFSIRSSIDYNPTFLDNSGLGPRHRQDNVRLSLGVLFH